MKSHLTSASGEPLSKDGSIHITDEVYNTIISGTGALLSLLGIFILLRDAVLADKFWHILSFSAYGFGLISVFVLSTLHHGVSGKPQTDKLLRLLDYLAIFFKIAGSLTPFILIPLRTPFGLTLLFLIWLIAVAGLIVKIKHPEAKTVLMFFYVGMGVISGLVLFPLFSVLGWGGISLLVGGGIFYLIGSVVYYLEKPNPCPGRFGFHEIWHCFVLAGSATQYFCIYFYLLPLQG